MNFFWSYAKKVGFEPINFGLLYNWPAATDARNICASGWHIPTKSEMETLVAYIGGATIAGGKLKETGTTYWDSPNTGAANDVGYNGRGAGYRISGIFSSIRRNLYCMTTTIYPPVNNYFLSCIYNVENTVLSFVTRDTGLSIRPIKDSTTLTHGQTGTYTDPSGFTYRTICIGTQEWVADNIKTQHYRNGDAIPEVTSNSAWAALTTGALCAYNNDWANV